MTTNNDKLTIKDFDPNKLYTADYREADEGKIKIVQDGKTAQFSTFEASESFIKTSKHTVR